MPSTIPTPPHPPSPLFPYTTLFRSSIKGNAAAAQGYALPAPSNRVMLSPALPKGANMSRTGQLYDLQQVDSALDSRVARMRLIDEQAVESAELIAARASRDEASAHMKEMQANLKKTSHESDETASRIRTQDKRLYDGTIKNPKE